MGGVPTAKYVGWLKFQQPFAEDGVGELVLGEVAEWSKALVC